MRTGALIVGAVLMSLPAQAQQMDAREARADLGLLYARRHKHTDAMQCAERAMAAAPWCPYSIGVMAAALVNDGQAERAQPLLVALRGDAYGGPVGLAVYFLARGEIEQAVEWSARAAEQRFPAFIPRVIRAFEPSLRRRGQPC